MSSLSPSAKQQFFTNAGIPAIGYKLYTYAAGTSYTTPQATYTDAALASPNTNPITLDARGEAVIYLPDNLAYDYVLKDVLGTTIWTRDGIQSDVKGISADLASTASGKGAAMVGFLQSGTGAVARTVQSKNRDVINAADFGAVGDGVADDTAAIQAAINRAAALNGGNVDLNAGTFKITATLTILTSNVTLTGQGGSGGHDGGTNLTAATTLAWYGAAGGTMLSVGTPDNAAFATQTGIGVHDLMLDCRASAAIGLLITSVRGGVFSGIHVTNATNKGYLLTVCATASPAEVRGTQSCRFERCSWRMIDSAPVQSAHGMWMTAPVPGASNGNPSFNTFDMCGGQTYNGHGFVFEDADNNTLSRCSAAIAGPGTFYAYVLAGGYCQTFVACSGYYHVAGTASGYWQNSYGTVIYAQDQANGWGIPTADAGCTFQFHGNKYGSYQSLSWGSVVSDTSIGAFNQLTNLGTDTLLVHNASSGGIVQTDGSRKYQWSIDGTGIYRLLKTSGGSGILDFSQGTTVSVKFNNVGFNGTNAIAKPTVTGSKGGNAALTSLMAALSAYGLVTDSTT